MLCIFTVMFHSQLYIVLELYGYYVYVCVCVCLCVCLVAQLCLTLCDPMELQPTRLLCPWGLSRQNYWNGLPCPPPGDLLNPDLPHCRQILYWLSHQGIPMNTYILVYWYVYNKYSCNPVDCSLPGSSVHGIFQARIMEGLSFPPPGNLPDPGIKPMSPVSPALQAGSLSLNHWGRPKYS